MDSCDTGPHLAELIITYIYVNKLEIAQRLSPEESRAAALEAARDLLLEAGPQAVTLKAVAAEIGKSHANLLHHFGSAAGLQAALAGHISDRSPPQIAARSTAPAHSEADPSEIVDRTFDAFDKERRRGACRLASWHRDALNRSSMRSSLVDRSRGP